MTSKKLYTHVTPPTQANYTQRVPASEGKGAGSMNYGSAEKYGSTPAVSANSEQVAPKAK